MRALILRAGALGDTLMLAPALSDLYNRTKIVLVGRSPGIHFLKPFTESIIDFERGNWHQFFLEKPDNLPKLSEIDLAVCFIQNHHEIFKKNIESVLPNRPVYIFPAFPGKHVNTHMALYTLQCLEKAGFSINPEVVLEQFRRRPVLSTGRGDYIREGIVFHPGSGSPKKNYPPEFWIRLMDLGNKCFPGEKSSLILGPAEESYFPFYQKTLTRKDVEIVLNPKKEKLMNLLNGAEVYIGHDSGITHLAAMLGTPTIVLFKDSNVNQWRPVGPIVRVIEKDERALDSAFNQILGAARELVN